MTVVRVIAARGSCRVYVVGLRCHHGMTGLALALAGLAMRRRRCFLLGCLLIAHDWRDWPWPLLDR